MQLRQVKSSQLNAMMSMMMPRAGMFQLTPVQTMAFSSKESPKQRLNRRKELDSLMKQWYLKVGFEFHVQLKTKHKMFSTAECSSLAEPNTHANFVDLGLPGMLPVLNESCLDLAIKASLALGGRILTQIKFDRKHYVYADLPQAYQITQKHNPIMLDGRLFFFNYQDNEAHILIDRIQMEQDTAKSIYKGDKVLIDYNRSGMPLIEIVTVADQTHPEDAKLIVRELQELLSSLDISDAQIDQGQLRVDVNVSVHSDKASGPRVEIKNVSGAKNVERAVEFEYRRHIDLLSRGLTPDPETRRYDASLDKTISLRHKEEEPDYRFFQDPDLPAFRVSNARISRAHKELKEIPYDVKKRFCNQFGMDVSDVKIIFRNPWSVEVFTRLVFALQIDPKMVYKWVYENIYGNCLRKDLDFREVMEISFGHKKLVELLRMINDEEVSAANAKQIMMMIIDGDERQPSTIAEQLGFVGQVQTSEELRLACEQVISENADVVHKIIKTGRPGPAMHLVGKVMKLTERRGDPVIIKSLIEDIIKQKGSQVTQEDKHDE